MDWPSKPGQLMSPEEFFLKERDNFENVSKRKFLVSTPMPMPMPTLCVDEGGFRTEARLDENERKHEKELESETDVKKVRERVNGRESKRESE